MIKTLNLCWGVFIIYGLGDRCFIHHPFLFLHDPPKRQQQTDEQKFNDGGGEKPKPTKPQKKKNKKKKKKKKKKKTMALLPFLLHNFERDGTTVEYPAHFILF